MRHSLAVLSALLLGGCEAASTRPVTRCEEVTGPCALVTFAWDSRPDTMHVLVTHGPTIDDAIAYLASGEGAGIPSGLILRGAGSDPALPFHYDPDSIRLVELAIELCDGRLMRTEAELNEYFRGSTGNANASRGHFCPWGARPVAVTQSP